MFDLNLLYESINHLTIALGMLAGISAATLATFLFCKLINWLKEYDHKTEMHRQELKKFNQADKDDLMFYVRQEMRNFKEELKKEDNTNEKENNNM